MTGTPYKIDPDALVKDTAGNVTMVVQSTAYASLDSLRRGKATVADTINLAVAYNVTRALATGVGHGREHLNILGPWYTAMLHISDRLPPTATEQEQGAIWAGLALHDAQLEVVTLAEMTDTLDSIKPWTDNGRFMLMPPPRAPMGAAA